jgi:hypoxanthine phosphoribosyltransferase
MKLKKNITNNILILISVILVTSYNFLIQNGLEKMFFETYFDKMKFIRRPLNKCLNIKNLIPTHCVGMPSGHTESITIFACLLYFYKFIPLWLCIFLILTTALQRFLTNMHTISQIFFGILFGYIYSKIYEYFNFSIYSILIVLCIGLILSLLIIYKIDKQVNGKIPDWVDITMIESIKKKQNSPMYIKIGSIYVNSFIQDITYINWKQLEEKMDEMIYGIKQSGKKFDAVVGIKTGGAIISDYISLKLGLPNYKVKVSRSDYNCNKQPYHVVNDILKKQILNEFGKYTICEKINKNLKDQNIILVDEFVSTGITMEQTYNYLKNEKLVNYIYPTSVALYKKKYKSNLKINYVIDGSIIIYPWGYDN